MIEFISDSIRDEKIEGLKEKLESYDDEIDKLFKEARDAVKEIISKCEADPEEVIKILYTIRFLERIGDIVAKTGARLIYIEKGEHILIK